MDSAAHEHASADDDGYDPDSAPTSARLPEREIALTVAAVARRLGVAPATLRTWDRRYGLGPSAHTAGAHRRYAPGDLARLTVMRKLTLQGVSPAEAARITAGIDPGDPAASEPWALDPEPERVPDPGGGGRVVALPDGSPAARGLARAAMALDPRACADIINDSLEDHGVVSTWNDLLVPVLIGVGDRWSRTGEGIDVEHLLSECVMGVMRGRTDRLLEPANDRPVLLACAEGESHGIVLHVLAAALAERRIASRLLGAHVPRQALAAAIRRLGPAAVFVWSQLPVTGSGSQLEDLPGVRPRPALLVGGPGWDTATLPDGIRTTGALHEAVDVLVAATGN